MDQPYFSNVAKSKCARLSWPLREGGEASCRLDSIDVVLSHGR